MNSKQNPNSKNSKTPKNSSNHRSPSKKSVISSLSDMCGGGGDRYSTVRAKGRTPFPLALIIGMIVATVLFMFIIFSFVQVSELSSEISSMKGDIKSLSAEAKTLEGRLDYKYTKSEIESTASSLGLDSSRRTTVYFEGEASEDVSEVIEPENALGGAIDSLLSAIAKNFGKIIEFLN